MENNNIPAFPTIHPALDPRASGFNIVEGMTLRDYFAAKAMVVIFGAITPADILKHSVEAARKMTAEGAYAMADAMLTQRQKVEVER